MEWKDYNKIWDRYSIRIFYNYKIKECLDDKFDILLDYALISETLYNELINKLLNRLKKREKKVNSKFDKVPNPQSPIPNPQSPIPNFLIYKIYIN